MIQGFREFQATSLHVFNHCERSRHDKITNEPILERRRITLKIYIKNFLILTQNSLPDPSKLETKKSAKIKLYGVWARVSGQYEKNFDIDLQSNSSSFQNGLICDFIMFTSLTMIENMKRGSLKFWKSLPFPYKTSFWKN